MPLRATRAAAAALLLLAACARSSSRDEVFGLEVAPGSVDVAKGLSQRLVASALHRSGARTLADAAWSSDEPAIAGVDAEGVVTGRSPGATFVRASSGGLEAIVPVTVRPPVPVAIRLDPSGASLPVGLSQAFRAVGLWLSDGSVGALSGPVEWSSSDPLRLSVDAGGTARPLGDGVADVVATAGSLTGRATVLGLPPAPVGLALPPALALGRVERRDLGPVVTYTDGLARPLPAGAVITADDPAIVTAEGGTLVARQAGSTTVRVAAGGLTGAIPVSVAAHAVVFRTSTTGPGNLAAWPEAGGAVGQFAGDGICRARAAAGGLGGHFRAFLSTSTTDALCRAFGQEGRFASGCASGTVRSTRGAWVRRDGYRLGEDLLAIVEDGPLVPVTLDEQGTARLGLLWTGGASLAFPSTDHCADWSSAGPGTLGADGGADYTNRGWSTGVPNDCHFDFGLICVEVLDRPADPLPPIPPASGRRAFVTEATGSGDLSTWTDASGLTGVAAGHNVCMAEAARAGLPGAFAYRAWLSDGVTDARAWHTELGPWSRVDGVPLAGSLSDLVDTGPLFTSLSLTAQGRPAFAWTWTGTGADGRRTADTCAGWTSAQGSGTFGLTTSVQAWTASFTNDCATAKALLCFEQ